MHDQHVQNSTHPNRAMPIDELLRAPSWSVEYHGLAYDDARQVRGIWYVRDPVEHGFMRFGVQNAIVQLFENPK